MSVAIALFFRPFEQRDQPPEAESGAARGFEATCGARDRFSIGKGDLSTHGGKKHTEENDTAEAKNMLCIV